MRTFLLLVCFGLLSPPSFAGSTAFKDSFRAFLDMRKLEEQSAILSARTDLEPGLKHTQVQELSSRVTQARIDFHSILPAERGSLSPWEKSVLDRLDSRKPKKEARTADEEALAYLRESLPAARDLSAFEWQAIGEFYGLQTQQAFLDSTFSAETLPGKGGTDNVKRFAVWVNTPSFPILSKAGIAQLKAERAVADRKLVALGYQVEEVEVSTFIRIEDQAEDLQKSLKLRLAKGDFLLLSHGPASAVLLRTFDLYPDLLAREGINGWVNLNGQLFGVAQESSSRMPASAQKVTVADRQHLDVRQEFLRLQQERLDRQAPLGAKFPVLNVVTLGGKYRPAANLRESMVPEGKTLFLREGSGFSRIGSALPVIVSP